MSRDFKGGGVDPELQGVAEQSSYLPNNIFSTHVFRDVFLCKETVLEYNSQYMSRLSQIHRVTRAYPMN